MINYLTYRKWVASEYTCISCGAYTTALICAHHLFQGVTKKERRNGSAKDLFVIPVCKKHHGEMHNSGVEKYDKDHGINLWHEAAKLLNCYLNSPG